MRQYFIAKQGIVEITPEGIKVPKTLRAGQCASVLGLTRVIPKVEVAFVIVGDRNRQYMTGARAAGAIATGGIALLAPSRMRASLVIAQTDGSVLAFELQRRDAKRVEAIEAAFAAAGYRTSPPTE
jgi:hypothetical protein